jgi:hypothetical protein
MLGRLAKSFAEISAGCECCERWDPDLGRPEKPPPLFCGDDCGEESGTWRWFESML